MASTIEIDLFKRLADLKIKHQEEEFQAWVLHYEHHLNHMYKMMAPEYLSHFRDDEAEGFEVFCRFVYKNTTPVFDKKTRRWVRPLLI